VITAVPHALSFRTGIGTPVEKSIRIANASVATIQLTNDSFTLAGQDASLFTLSGLPARVVSKADHGIGVTYTPTSAGDHTATLQIVVDKTKITITLTGKAQ
jgi:hypothetical protein